jgi:hypothetical protein
MLWFDNDKSADLVTKIQRAAAYYKDKYGRSVNTCYIHPAMVTNPVTVPGIEIKTSRSVIPNHFWMGIVVDNADDS